MDNPVQLCLISDMDSDVLIAGGGLNGPALALALTRAGLRVTIIDARPPLARAQPGFDARAYALAIASKRLLSAIDIWPLVAEMAQPILKIRTCDGRVGRGPFSAGLSFDSNEIEEGPMGFMVEDRFLYRAFLDSMQASPQIELIAPDNVVGQSVEDSRVVVRLASGREISAQLLVGCDGRQSGVAERANIRRRIQDYGQTALVSIIWHERPHEGIAYENFLPGGPFAILPLAGGHHSCIIWAEDKTIAAGIKLLPDEDFLAALGCRIGDFLGRIELASKRFDHPLNMSLADSFVAPRIALVGDSAHGVHPVAGQGLNLGLRDVAALAEVIIRATRRGEDIGADSILAEYQSWRRPDTVMMSYGMDCLVRLFSNDNPLLRLGRNLGLGAVNAMPSLRRHFIRQAAGLTGDLPRLLTGRQI